MPRQIPKKGILRVRAYSIDADFPFSPPLAETAGDKDAVNIVKGTINAVLLNLLGIDILQHDPAVIGDAAMGQGFCQ